MAPAARRNPRFQPIPASYYLGLTTAAHEMGYLHPTEIPYRLLRDYCRILVNRFGRGTATKMVSIQATHQKTCPSKSLNKFARMFRILEHM